MGKELDKELSDIIREIVDIITAESDRVERELAAWRKRDKEEQTIETMAKVVELKILRGQIDKIRKKVRVVLKGSTNRLLISIINPGN